MLGTLYLEDLNDYREALERTLLIEQSAARAAALTRLLGVPLQTEPRRRADLDLFVLLAEPVPARSIRSLLPFLFAGGIPTWGSSLACGDCHKDMNTDTAAPGSHRQHAQTSNIACAVCHNGYTETTVAAATHANQTVNLSFSGPGAGTFYTGGTTSGTHTLGGGYGTCYNISCHPSGQSPTGGPAPLIRRNAVSKECTLASNRKTRNGHRHEGMLTEELY